MFVKTERIPHKNIERTVKNSKGKLNPLHKFCFGWTNFFFFLFMWFLNFVNYLTAFIGVLCCHMGVMAEIMSSS